MKTIIIPLFLVLAFLLGTASVASSTVTLAVQNMTCAVCPITDKKALVRVSGVQVVTVDYASKTAMMQFDDKVATVDKLTEATKFAGYLSFVQRENK